MAELHELFGIWEALESDLFVQTVGIKGREKGSLEFQGAQGFHNGFCQEQADAETTCGRIDVDIACPGEGRVIGDDAGVTDQVLVGI